MSGQVVLNQFLLIDVSLIVTNIYFVVFLMYFSLSFIHFIAMQIAARLFAQ